MRWHEKSWTALTVPLPVKKYPDKVANKVPNNILRNPPFCSFVSFLMVWLTPFITKPDSLGDLFISMISSIEIINAVAPGPNIFLQMAASVVDVAALNPNGIKTLLANGLSIFPIKSNPVFSNGSKSLPKNPPHCPSLCNWVFDNFVLAEELFGKTLQSFETLKILAEFYKKCIFWYFLRHLIQ